MMYVCGSKKKRYTVIAAGGVVGFLLFLTFFFFPTSQAVIGTPISPAETASLVTNEEWIPELPVRLVIPRIEVDAEIQYVGIAENGTGEMGIPSNFTDVGWYQPGVRPGMKGSAVIAGHLNGKGVPEAVFYDLDKLEVGDEVIVLSAKRVEDIFRVVRVESYDYNESATEVFVSTDDRARLNLITCGGVWLPEESRYEKRTVVFTELMTDVE
jgi:LPXTG-site transpeptidase (sortase) family protein